VEIVFVLLGNGGKQGERDVLADDGSRLEQLLVISRQTVDARRKDCLDGRRDLDPVHWLRERVCATLPPQDTGLDQRSHALFDEERIAPRLVGEKTLEGLERGITSKQCDQQLFRAVHWQRIDSEERVVTLAGPRVLVLGPVRQDEKQSHRRHAADDGVQERLGLRVDPVQILEDYEDRLDLALAAQESLHRIERPLPALRRIETLPVRIVGGGVQEHEERRHGSLQRGIERGELAHNSVPDLGVRISILDPEVASEQARDREIARALAVGHRAGFEHETPGDVLRTGELEHETRLADPSLANDRHHLPVPTRGRPKTGLQSRELILPAHESRGGAPERQAVALPSGETVDALAAVRLALGRCELETPLEKRLGRGADERRGGLALASQPFDGEPVSALVLGTDFDPRPDSPDQE
jgi:hypothetical protein